MFYISLVIFGFTENFFWYTLTPRKFFVLLRKHNEANTCEDNTGEDVKNPNSSVTPPRLTPEELRAWNPQMKQGGLPPVKFLD